MLTNKNDSYSNMIANLNKKNLDKTTATTIEPTVLFEDKELSDFYVAGGVLANIVDMPADDMTKNGWVIGNDKEKLIAKDMKRLNVNTVFNKALKYSRLYRGSIIVVVTQFGALDKLMPKNPGKITHLKVYSAARIDVMPTDIVTDPKSPYYEDVEFFNVRLRNGTTIKVHRSRCLVFNGELMPDDSDYAFKYRYWGLSVIQRVWDDLKNYGATMQGVGNIMLEAVIGKYTLSNLAELLAQNTKESLDKIYTRIETINASKSVINAVLLGKDESYERDSVNLSGIEGIIDKMMISVASSARIAVTLLFQRSPAGMNATGESDIRNYYNLIKSKQYTVLEEPIQALAEIIGKDVYPNNTEPYLVIFNSLMTATKKEEAEIDHLNSQAASNWIAMQVLTDEQAQQIYFPALHSLDGLGDDE